VSAWSIFTQGGGKGAALTWAQDLLQADNAPDTQANEQFVYDWEVSEGGGGKYNPLNQGVVPGNTSLTSTGNQYGGGAADYVSWQAGIQGAVDFLNMPNYQAVQAALKANDPVAARQALIQSPWAASHYGNGSSFSNSPLPGQATSLLGSGSVVTTDNTTGTVTNANWFTNLFTYNGQISDLKSLFGALLGSSGSVDEDLQGLVIRGALILFGAALILVGAVKLTGSGKTAVEIVTSPVKGVKGLATGGGTSAS
jgi:hypothetical protein